jgi:hypothetical protein
MASPNDPEVSYLASEDGDVSVLEGPVQVESTVETLLPQETKIVGGIYRALVQEFFPYGDGDQSRPLRPCRLLVPTPGPLPRPPPDPD